MKSRVGLARDRGEGDREKRAIFRTKTRSRSLEFDVLLGCRCDASSDREYRHSGTSQAIRRLVRLFGREDLVFQLGVLASGTYIVVQRTGVSQLDPCCYINLADARKLGR